MGYTTEFKGTFLVNKKLDDETKKLLNGLAKTRRMKRSIPKLAEMLNITEEEALHTYGTDGEFYFNEKDFHNSGQTDDNSIIDHNCPPETQPELWLQWVYNEEKQCIEWDGREKFYGYIEWLEYIIDRILKPKKYSLTGVVQWNGEDAKDIGSIVITDNVMTIDTNKNNRRHDKDSRQKMKQLYEILKSLSPNNKNSKGVTMDPKINIDDKDKGKRKGKK